MARVTEIKTVATPSAIEVKDARGRVLALRKPNVLAQFRLIEMLGATAENRIYLAMSIPLLYLQSIDGEAANFSTRRELEALIQQLDDDGIAALQEAIGEHFAPPSEDATKAVAKKSHGTQD